MQSIVFLGTGAATPTSKRNVSSYALRLTSGKVWLVDCGEGTQHQIGKTDLVKPGRLSTIFVTHLHGDHSFGLPGLLASLSLLAGTPDKQIQLIGPVGTKQFVETAVSLSATWLTYDLKVHEIDATNFTPVDLGIIDDIRVWACPLKHKVPCLGFVVQEQDKPGVLDAALAGKLGAKGKDLGLLKAGKDVTLADGKVIKASEVVGAPQKGRVAVLLGDTSNSDVVAKVVSEIAPEGVHALVHECTFDAPLKETAIKGGHSTSHMAGSQGDTTIQDLVTQATSKCPNGKVVAAEDLANFDL